MTWAPLQQTEDWNRTWELTKKNLTQHVKLTTHIRTQELDSRELLLNRARTQVTRPPATRKNPWYL